LLKEDDLMFWESRTTTLPKPVFSNNIFANYEVETG
jgi:hypothetical protein